MNARAHIPLESIATTPRNRAPLIVTLAAISIVLIAGCYGPPGGNPGNPGGVKPTIVMQSGAWSAGNLTASVIDSAGDAVAPADLVFQIVSSSGTFLFNGASGNTTTEGGTSTTVTYMDTGGAGADMVGAGDVIRVSASPNANALHGATLKVLVGSDVMGTNVLP